MTTTQTPATLADALPKEMERVRHLIPLYESIGSAGIFAIAMMKRDLELAQIAMMEGDVVGMIRQLESLKGYES